MGVAKRDSVTRLRSVANMFLPRHRWRPGRVQQPVERIAEFEVETGPETGMGRRHGNGGNAQGSRLGAIGQADEPVTVEQAWPGMPCSARQACRNVG